MRRPQKILITGASGLLGSRLVKQMSSLGHDAIAISRSECPDELKQYCQWYRFDLTHASGCDIDANTVIHCAPLWYLPEFVNRMTQRGRLKRCIAFSSTSVLAKADAADAQDRELAEKLQHAEKALNEICDESLNITLLRPTMIYGHVKDKNITVIANFIKKYGFFPVAGKADGLRQPVHVDDLVQVVIEILDNETTFGKTYILAGGDRISYKTMVETIFTGLKIPPRILNLPVPLYRLLLVLAGGDYSKGAANRMNQNLVYDIDNAVSDFNYLPQGFLKFPGRDLP